MRGKREAILAAHKAKRAAITSTATATATAAGSTAMSGGDSSSSTGGTDKKLAIHKEQADGSEVVTTEELPPTSRTRTLPVTAGAPTPAPNQPTASSLPPPDSKPARSSSPSTAPAPAPAPAHAQAQAQASTRPPPNPKAEKLWALHVRKIKMAAAPLDPTSASSKAATLAPIASGSGSQSGAGAGAGMKRFFEWTVGSAQEVRDWEAAGKWPGKGVVRRAWVPMVCPLTCSLVFVLIGDFARIVSSPDAGSESVLTTKRPRGGMAA